MKDLFALFQWLAPMILGLLFWALGKDRKAERAAISKEIAEALEIATKRVDDAGDVLSTKLSSVQGRIGQIEVMVAQNKVNHDEHYRNHADIAARLGRLEQERRDR